MAEFGLIVDCRLGIGDYSWIDDWCPSPQSAFCEYSAINNPPSPVNPNSAINESAM